MPSLKNIRFQKVDKYDNLIFIANQTEKENYEDLKDKALKLKNRFETFSPIFHSEKHNYSTIRFVKNTKVRVSPLGGKASDGVPLDPSGRWVTVEQDCVYDIDYVIKLKNKNDKTYANCFINTIKFIKKNERDDGEVLEL